MGGHGGKLFIKSVQILIIFSLLIDEKRRKKRIIPKLPTSKPASIGVSARIPLASGLPLIDARAPLTTNIRLATKCNYRNTVASYRNFYKQFCFFFTDLRPVLIFIDDSVFSPVILTDISQFYPRWPQKFETIFT